MDRKKRVRLAFEMHGRIREALARMRTTKVEVYLLLREFKRAKLFRCLDVPVAPSHARQICAGRRFPTWEDYLTDLGKCGISFSYFAELERLERRFGEAFVRLCAVGVPVRLRRILLRAGGRAVEEVNDILRSRDTDAEKIEQIYRVAEAWESDWEMSYPRWDTPRARALRYYRRTKRLQEMFSKLVDETAKLPDEYRRGRTYAWMVHAWKEFFAAHLDVGQRLARLELSPLLSGTHADLLGRMCEMWDRHHQGAPGFARRMDELSKRRDDEQAA